MEDDTILCPECGWSGSRGDIESVEGAHSCPVCDTDIELVK